VEDVPVRAIEPNVDSTVADPKITEPDEKMHGYVPIECEASADIGLLVLVWRSIE
jgi:hypothetical protein